MNIPKTMKIGGNIYKVRMIAGDETNFCGRLKRTTGEILISSDMMRSQREATFIHEIFHVMNGEMNETIIDSLSEQMYQVLHDNKLQF